MKKVMEAVLTLAEFPACAMVALFLHRNAVQIALMERGYEAVGGEIFVFPMAFLGLIALCETVISRCFCE